MAVLVMLAVLLLFHTFNRQTFNDGAIEYFGMSDTNLSMSMSMSMLTFDNIQYDSGSIDKSMYHFQFSTLEQQFPTSMIDYR